jgi:cytoskeletal protein CcmA (bactofilin family)
MTQLVTMVVSFVLLLGVSAGAKDARGDASDHDAVMILPVGAVINQDYFAYGERVEISGTVNGDVYVAGGQVLVDGRINGDLLAAGGTITIAGSVSQDVRVVGGQITLNGSVGRNLTVAGGDVDLSESAVVAGGLVSAGGRVRLAAPIGAGARIAAGSVIVSGPVRGNLDVMTGDLRLTSKAAVSGGLTYWSQERASIDSGAKVGGGVTRKALPEISRPRAESLLGALAGVVIVAKLVSAASTLILGLLLIYLFPGYTQSTVSTLSARPAASFALGLVALIVTPVAAIMLLVTVLGLPIGLMAIALYLVAIFLVRVFVIMWLGRALLSWGGREVRDGWALVVGVVVYSVVTLIPFVGGGVALAAIVFGLGASLLADRALYVAPKERESV